MGQNVMTFIAPHKALKIKEKGIFRLGHSSFKKETRNKKEEDSKGNLGQFIRSMRAGVDKYKHCW